MWQIDQCRWHLRPAWMVLLGMLGAAGCSETPKVPAPPIEVPFSLDKGGETADLAFKITEKYVYTFGLGFMVNKHEPNGVGRVLTLMEDWIDVSTGKHYSLGVPLTIRLQLKLLTKDMSSLVFDKTESKIALSSWSSNKYNKEIAALQLEPGEYTVDFIGNWYNNTYLYSTSFPS
jgi:hypothetical protein